MSLFDYILSVCLTIVLITTVIFLANNSDFRYSLNGKAEFRETYYIDGHKCLDDANINYSIEGVNNERIIVDKNDSESIRNHCRMQ